MAFAFTREPIEAAALAAAVTDPAAGGFAAFEGRVRNHSEGRAVMRLDYEAFEPLALAEGADIVARAVAAHGATAARCVHRLGTLAVGDTAVWVGVAAPHRAEAFAACRAIIDAVKHRLPIWKKEHYAGGDSGWVNCDHCAPTLPATGYDYSRQMTLPEVGASGQQRLSQATVVVIGAGGLGCTVLAGLAGAGIGTLRVIDHDLVEASNLHRQPLYGVADIGRPKAVVAAERLSAANPSIRVEAQPIRVAVDNVEAIVASGAVIVDCSDNFATKFLINDAAVAAGRVAVLASVFQYEGQLQVVRPGRDASCLRCVWPEATRDGLIGNCAQAGVLGPVPAALGALQAMEVLKHLLDLPGQLQNELLLIDLLQTGVQRLAAPRNAACRAHAAGAGAKSAVESPADLELELSLADAERRGYRIIDIRNPDEWAREPLPGASHERIAMPDLLGGQRLHDESRYLLVCAHGIRSLAAAAELRARGSANVWSLKGGIAGA